MMKHASSIVLRELIEIAQIYLSVMARYANVERFFP